MESLSKIKGIGKETIDDLRRVYSDEWELKKALESNKVPLRNDIVRKLKNFFGLSP